MEVLCQCHPHLSVLSVGPLCNKILILLCSSYCIRIFFSLNHALGSNSDPADHKQGSTKYTLPKKPKIWNKYSQKRNIEASVPISTFMCLWANYIFPRLVCLFCWRKYVDRSWEYINRSQTHECGNWGWCRVIPRKGIYKRNCRCSALLVLPYRSVWWLAVTTLVTPTILLFSSSRTFWRTTL